MGSKQEQNFVDQISPNTEATSSSEKPLLEKVLKTTQNSNGNVRNSNSTSEDSKTAQEKYSDSFDSVSGSELAIIPNGISGKNSRTIGTNGSNYRTDRGQKVGAKRSVAASSSAEAGGSGGTVDDNMSNSYHPTTQANEVNKNEKLTSHAADEIDPNDSFFD